MDVHAHVIFIKQKVSYPLSGIVGSETFQFYPLHSNTAI